MKTLIFGAGKWGQVLQSYIEKTSQYTLVGFIDNNASGDKIYGHSLYKPSNIHNVDYDKIIIAVGGNSVLTQIKNN